MSDLIDRRTLFKAAGAGVAVGSVRVAQVDPTHPAIEQSGIAAGDLIMRKIPKGEDMLPAIMLVTRCTISSF